MATPNPFDSKLVEKARRITAPESNQLVLEFPADLRIVYRREVDDWNVKIRVRAERGGVSGPSEGSTLLYWAPINAGDGNKAVHKGYTPSETIREFWSRATHAAFHRKDPQEDAVRQAVSSILE